MSHLRKRFASPLVLKLAKLWPIVGVLGLRQAGKSTLLKELLHIKNRVTLDDLYSREEANRSPSAFLAKSTTPLAIDEVQKAPPLFDALKLQVDEARVPGSYYLTGSTTFSSKLGIRESLTGRIGLLELLPLTLAELHSEPFCALKKLSQPFNHQRQMPRFTSNQFVAYASTGGMPMPAFLRDTQQRDLYWHSWLDTTIHRDMARFFRRGFSPDLAFSLLATMGETLRRGELPTLKHFAASARLARNYLQAMEDLFLLRKMHCHPAGEGKEIWLFKDAGLAAHMMQRDFGADASLSLLRHALLNEICAQAEYQGKRLSLWYYKSAHGSPVDLILDGIPFRIVSNVSALTHQRSWEERPLRGAMKKLNSKSGYLIGPVAMPELPKDGEGIGVLPWSSWS